MNVRDHLIRVVADGEFHSGSALARTLGVSRSAIWKQIHRLAEFGLDVETVRGRGYRLVRPIELLDHQRIMGRLDAETNAACEALEVTSVAGSTSAMLIEQPAPPLGRWRAALAEYQTGGRGRRGRRWVSPFGSGLCLSVSYCFAAAPRDLQALSLAAGIGAMRTLTGIGAGGLTLKWPNDIVLAGRKLGGILADVDGDSHGPLRAVIGAGINLWAPDSLIGAVQADGGLPPAGLEEAMAGGRMERNVLAAGLIASLYRALRDFGRLGFGPLVDEWRRQDFLYGRFVTVRSGGEEMSGIACGIAPDGALLLDRPGGIAAVVNGDISLRAGA
jgi:BirA family biotin operon repressor/biotin-[acetyl-CoA-carboxylase] ligase